MIATPMFAAGQTSTADLVLTTSIAGRLQLKVTPAAITSVANFNSAASLTTQALTGDATQLYLNICSNQKTALTVSMTLPNLTTTGSSYQIPYTVTGDTVLTSASPSTAVAQIYKILDADISSGMRVVNVPFTIVLDSIPFQNAAIGDYSATVTLDVAAS
jgi:hypothetical protein